MRACQGCGVALPPDGQHRPRKWCSERCRKNSYDRVCAECGGRASGTDPGRAKTALCRTCATTSERMSRQSREGHAYHAEPRRQHIIKRWHEGASLRQIAVEVNSTVNAIGSDITRWRAQGYNLPRRHKGSYEQVSA